MEAPVLTTKRLVLRPFERSDLTDRYVSWLNDPQAVRHSEQRHRRHTRATCETYRNAMEERGDWFLAMLLRNRVPHHVGNLSVTFDRPNRTADLAILIGEADARGQGLGLEAWSAVLGDLLGRAAIRKVTAGTMAENEAMIALARRSGMAEEGRRPRHFLVDGREVDLVSFARYAEPQTGAGRTA